MVNLYTEGWLNQKNDLNVVTGLLEEDVFQVFRNWDLEQILGNIWQLNKMIAQEAGPLDRNRMTE